MPEEKSIFVVQSRANSEGAAIINTCRDGYHVWTRGISDGQTIDEVETVSSINQAFIADVQWSEIRDIALDSELQLVVSNTTAAGMQLVPGDSALTLNQHCPASFPAKLTVLLFERFQNQLPGVTLLPMELVDNNGDLLRSLVVQQSRQWAHTNKGEFIDWLNSQNRWLNNLVDRIVVSPSDPTPWQGEDPLAVVAEPFRMLAIQNDGKEKTPIPQHEMVTWTDDLEPFFKRKVRILNGLHTAMVARYLPKGFETVFQCVSDDNARKWLDQLLFDEIIPTLDAFGLSEEKFAHEVMERFENPFFKHRLSDIAQGHQTKIRIRIEPTFNEYRSIFGKPPAKLGEVMQSAAIDSIQLPQAT